MTPTSSNGGGAALETRDTPIVIECERAWPPLRLAELRDYDFVLAALIRREIKTRYAQTAVGMGWVVLQPVLTTVVLTVLLGRFVRASTGGIPYSLFAFSGLACWIYFTHVQTKACMCLVSNGNLVSKAYFPRLLLPLATAIGGLVDLGVASAVLVLLMAYHRVAPGAGILLLPVALALLLTTALGVGVWLAALNMRHRDITHALPFAIQICFFVTPVAYPLSVVPAAVRRFSMFNPMAGVIECFRGALFADYPVSYAALGVSAAVSVIVLVTGLYWFRREEQCFADMGNL